LSNSHNEKMFYTVEDVQRILDISKNRAYELVRNAYEAQSPFPVLKIGTIYRIPKEKFMCYARGDSGAD